MHKTKLNKNQKKNTTTEKNKLKTKKRENKIKSKIKSKTKIKNSPSIENYLKLYENGNRIRLLIMPNRSETATATLYFYFKVGSKHEKPKHFGISHFIEHMIYKGSKHYPNYLNITKIFDSNGISFNAFTSKDMTAYFYKFLSTPNNVELICKITADMLFNPLMLENEINPERNVIIQELKDNIDDIDEYINDVLETKILTGHPLANPIIGNITSLNNIKRGDLIAYHKQYYNPSNLLISFSGKMQHSYMECFNKYFSNDTLSNLNSKISMFLPLSLDLQRPMEIIPFTDTDIDTSLKCKIDCISKSLKQDYVHIIFKTAGYLDPNILIYKLLANILGGSMSSRLFIILREKLGLVYTIKCSLSNYEEVGYFDIITQCEHKNTIKCIEHIIKQLKILIKNGINTKELEENKKNYNDVFKMQFDDIDFENEYYSKQLLFNKKPETFSSRILKISSITENDINTISQQLFNFHKMHIITFGNIKEHAIRECIIPLI